MTFKRLQKQNPLRAQPQIPRATLFYYQISSGLLSVKWTLMLGFPKCVLQNRKGFWGHLGLKCSKLMIKLIVFSWIQNISEPCMGSVGCDSPIPGRACSISLSPWSQNLFLCTSIFHGCCSQEDTLTNSAPVQSQKEQKVASSISLGTFLFFKVKNVYSNILV